MRKSFVRTIRTVLAILVLFVAVCMFFAAALIYFIDPNKIKPLLISEVENKTGYKLKIDGKMSWSFYPYLGVKVERMIFTAPSQQNSFIDLQNVKIATELKPLIRGNKNLQGNVQIAALTFANMHLRDVHLSLHWQNQILRIEPIQAVLYGGKLQGTAQGRNLAKQPQWDWKINAKNIAIKPLLNDVNGENSKIKLDGMGEIDMIARTTGKTHQQVVSNLEGNLQLKIDQGVVEGVDLNYFIQTADALLNNQTLNAENTDRTRFDQILGTITLQKGTARTDNLLLNAPAFTANTKGFVNMQNRTLNLLLTVKPQKENQVHWMVPIALQGPVEHPEIRIDLAELKKNITAADIDQAKNNLQEQIKKHIPEDVGDFLQHLLKR